MSEQVDSEPERNYNINHILLLSAALLLPGTLWVVFGWTSCFLPLIALTYLSKYGWRYGNKHLMIAVLAASFGGVIFNSLELTLFSVSLLPAGYAIAYSAQRNDEPWLSGLLGVVALSFSLFLYFSIAMSGSDTSFMQALNDSLSSGIDEALKQYRHSQSMSAENYILLEQTLYQMKTVAPLIMPAILGSLLIVVSWTTMLLGNSILPRIGIAVPWKEFRLWQLPEKLIWLLIGSGIFSLLPGDLTRVLGINCLILTALPYAFQGLAITVFWLNKWKVPKFVRTLIYVMIFLQSFGTVFLILIGIADVWFDLRKLSKGQIDSETDSL